MKITTFLFLYYLFVLLVTNIVPMWFAIVLALLPLPGRWWFRLGFFVAQDAAMFSFAHNRNRTGHLFFHLAQAFGKQCGIKIIMEGFDSSKEALDEGELKP